MNYGQAMELSREVARIASNDLETQTGCIVLDKSGNVAAVGWNRLTPGVSPTPELCRRPEKYKWIVHSERHAIVTARKSLQGFVMVLPWFPCAECAQEIAFAEISRLVCFQPDFDDERWGQDFRKAEVILKSAGVDLFFFDKENHS